MDSVLNQFGCLILFASGLVTGCSERGTTGHEGLPFQIAVVGNGVGDEETEISRAFLIERSRGRDVWEGAKAALEQSPALREHADLIELLPVDDGARPKTARSEALGLQANSRVLAVVGHTTSTTTRIGATIYSEVGLPIIMPIATSPLAGVNIKHGINISAPRMPGCVQLLPADDCFQAPAVSVLIKDKLRAGKCFLVRDDTSETLDYSKPLFDAVDELLTLDTIRETCSTPQELRSIVGRIRAESPDVIAFCGYGTNAITLLEFLRKEYGIGRKGEGAVDGEDGVDPLPTIVMTDGVVIPDLDPTGFEVLVTFPAPPLQDLEATTEDGQILRESIESQERDPSYQYYSYDAMLLIGHAIDACLSRGLPLNRHTVRRELMSLDSFPGSSMAYTLSEGRCQGADYYVYKCKRQDREGASMPVFEFAYSIKEADLIRESQLLGDS